MFKDVTRRLQLDSFATNQLNQLQNSFEEFVKHWVVWHRHCTTRPTAVTSHTQRFVTKQLVFFNWTQFTPKALWFGFDRFRISLWQHSTSDCVYVVEILWKVRKLLLQAFMVFFLFFWLSLVLVCLVSVTLRKIGAPMSWRSVKKSVQRIGDSRVFVPKNETFLVLVYFLCVSHFSRLNCTSSKKFYEENSHCTCPCFVIGRALLACAKKASPL